MWFIQSYFLIFYCFFSSHLLFFGILCSLHNHPFNLCAKLVQLFFIIVLLFNFLLIFLQHFVLEYLDLFFKLCQLIILLNYLFFLIIKYALGIIILLLYINDIFTELGYFTLFLGHLSLELLNLYLQLLVSLFKFVLFI